MPPRIPSFACPLVIGALLLGCSKTDNTGAKFAALEARLDRIEKRLAVSEDRLAAVGPLDETVRDLQRRVATAEARSAAAQSPEPTTPRAPSAPGGASPARPTTRGEATELPSGNAGPEAAARRAAVGELGAALQARLAHIREQPDTPPAERLRAVREAHRWYRERLRAILRGEETGAGGAGAPAK
jgi:uncharacterized membrane protein YccC